MTSERDRLTYAVERTLRDRPADIAEATRRRCDLDGAPDPEVLAEACTALADLVFDTGFEATVVMLELPSPLDKCPPAELLLTAQELAVEADEALRWSPVVRALRYRIEVVARHATNPRTPLRW